MGTTVKSKKRASMIRRLSCAAERMSPRRTKLVIQGRPGQKPCCISTRISFYLIISSRFLRIVEEHKRDVLARLKGYVWIM